MSTWRRLARMAVACVLAVILAGIMALGFTPPAKAQTMTVPTAAAQAHGPIRVQAEPGLEPLAAEVAARAPAVLAGIRADLDGLPVPETIEIRLVKRAADLGRAAPPGRGAPEWASGVAYPDLGVVVVATRHGAQPIDVHSTVAHELAHLALGAALGGREPRWLTEGFAYIHSSDWSMARVSTLVGMVWSGNVMALHELEHGFPARESATHRAYAQSYDLVAFLARRGRYPDVHDDGDPWPFRRFLAGISHGKSVEEAAFDAYGTSLPDLFDEWRQDLRRRYLLVPVSLVTLGLWALGGVLLVIAYFRRRRQGRRRLDEWAAEEQAATAARTDIPPSYSPSGSSETLPS